MINKDKFKGIVIGVVFTLMFSLIGTSSLANPIKKSIQVIYDDVKIVLDGTKINPKDAKGNKVEPFIYKGTTYLPVRAISEAFGKNVDWDRNTSTVYIGEKAKVTYNSCRADEFIERHEPYEGYAFYVGGPETLKIRQQDFQVFNSIFTMSGHRAKYLINGNYTKMKGLLLICDNNLCHARLKVTGDGIEFFDSEEFLKEKGFEDGYIHRGDKNQPVPFEIDITGVEELEIYVDSDIYNVEFIGFDK